MLTKIVAVGLLAMLAAACVVVRERPMFVAPSVAARLDSAGLEIRAVGPMDMGSDAVAD